MSREAIQPKSKSKSDCWNEFWDIIAPALVDLHNEGRLPVEEPAAA